jgi:hypothetical protein
MNRWMAARYIVCVVIIFLCIPPLAADSPVQRAVSPEKNPGDGFYSVTLTLPADPVWGITETFSPEITFEGTSLPAESYRIREHQLDLAFPDSNEITYTISVPPGDTGEISGTWINMLTGENGTLPSARISADGVISISSAQGNDLVPVDKPPGTKSPVSPVLCLLAIGIAGALLALWRRAE